MMSLAGLERGRRQF